MKSPWASFFIIIIIIIMFFLGTGFPSWLSWNSLFSLFQRRLISPQTWPWKGCDVAGADLGYSEDELSPEFVPLIPLPSFWCRQISLHGGENDTGSPVPSSLSLLPGKPLGRIQVDLSLDHRFILGHCDYGGIRHPHQSSWDSESISRRLGLVPEVMEWSWQLASMDARGQVCRNEREGDLNSNMHELRFNFSGSGYNLSPLENQEQRQFYLWQVGSHSLQGQWTKSFFVLG